MRPARKGPETALFDVADRVERGASMRPARKGPETMLGYTYDDGNEPRLQ